MANPEPTGSAPHKNAIALFLNSVWVTLRASVAPNYDDLSRKKQVLKSTVLTWTYPNGMPVPTEKRMRLMRELNRLDRLLRYHPDRPYDG